MAPTTKVYLLALLSAISAPLALAHGQVKYVVANGVKNEGGNIYYDGDAKNKNTATRIQYQASWPAYNVPADFRDNGKMACENAGGAPKTIKIDAGSTLQIYWQGATGELLHKGGIGIATSYNPWVHAMGPIMDYMTDCNGDCKNFNAANAGWTKIANAGIDMNQSVLGGLKSAMASKPENYWPRNGAGLWAIAKLVQQGSRWDVTIPKNLKNGHYIVRNELGAVHSPLGSDPRSGAQMYVACVQVEVVNGGSASLPSGTQAGQLYSPTGEFAKYNVYSDNVSNFQNFKVPGPAVWDGGSSSGGSNPGNGGGNSGGGSTPGKTCKKKRSLDAWQEELELVKRGRKSHVHTAKSRLTALDH